MIPATSRPAWAEIDPNALVANATLMQSRIGASKLCAVVKADGYGHGAVLTAKVLEANGVTRFAVANVDEALELREGGINSPILCLSESSGEAVKAALKSGISLTIYSRQGIDAVARAARDLELQRKNEPVRYHLKVDTGMHRVGAGPSDVLALAIYAREAGLVLEGFWTHLAVADSLSSDDRDFTLRQMALFQDISSTLLSGGFEPHFHTANSAASINYPASRLDMVRCGIALYGYSPSKDTTIDGLTPVLSLKARVSFVREVGPGVRPSYGRRRPTEGDLTVLATVPIGYADGVPRGLFEADQEVLIGGKRRKLAGMVTMDQIIVDCGTDRSIAVGDEVVLLGAQGEERITADDWAAKLDTINYEVITRIGFRVPRIIKSRDQLRPVGDFGEIHD